MMGQSSPPRLLTDSPFTCTCAVQTEQEYKHAKPSHAMEMANWARHVHGVQLVQPENVFPVG